MKINQKRKIEILHVEQLDFNRVYQCISGPRSGDHLLYTTHSEKVPLLAGVWLSDGAPFVFDTEDTETFVEVECELNIY